MTNYIKRTFTTLMLFAVTTIAFAQQSKYVTANELNVREGTGKEYASIGKVHKGDSVTVLSENGDWAEITFNDGTAYVSAQYLSDVKESSQKSNSTNSTEELPVGVWIFLGCAVAIIIGAFVYRKICLNKFSYDIFNFATLICLAIPFGIIIYVLCSDNNEIIGLSKTVFSIIMFSLTIIGLYFYNFKKTNWQFAIFNTIIQSVAVFIFVIIIAGRFILKIFFSGSSSNSSSSTTSSSGSSYSSSSSSNNRDIIRERWGSDPQEWEYDGKYLRKRWGSDSQEWEYDGKYLRKRWGSDPQEWEYDGKYLRKRWGSDPQEWEYDGKYLRKRWGSDPQEWVYDGKYLRKRWGSDPQEWEIEGNIPIIVIAKAVGII